MVFAKKTAGSLAAFSLMVKVILIFVMGMAILTKFLAKVASPAFVRIKASATVWPASVSREKATSTFPEVFAKKIKESQAATFFSTETAILILTSSTGKVTSTTLQRGASCPASARPMANTTSWLECVSWARVTSTSAECTEAEEESFA